MVFMVKCEQFKIDDSAIITPADPEEAKSLEILRGPNIKKFPDAKPQDEQGEQGDFGNGVNCVDDGCTNFIHKGGGAGDKSHGKTY